MDWTFGTRLNEASNHPQKDLIPIFGAGSIVSEILHRKRGLTTTHIARLSKRLRVFPAVFF